MTYSDLVERYGTQLLADLALVDAATWWIDPNHLVYFIEDGQFFRFSMEDFAWIPVPDAELRFRESLRPFLSDWGIKATKVRFNAVFDHVKERFRHPMFTDLSLIFDNGVLIWQTLFPLFVPRDLYETDPDHYHPPKSFSRIRCKFLDEPGPIPLYDKIKLIYPETVDAIERHAHNAIFNYTVDEQFLLIIGTRNTGKTTLYQIFEKALQDIAVNATLQSLSEDGYGRIKCYRKRLLLKNDHPESRLDSSALEFFKNMVEPGVLQLRQLYCPAFDWRHSGFCGIITTNKPPYVPESTDFASWFRRWEIVEMNIPQQKDPTLKTKILHEIDSIISRVVQREHERYWDTHDIDQVIKERQKIYMYWRHPVRFAIDACFEITNDQADKISIYDVDEVVTAYLLDHGFTIPKQKTLHEQITEFFSEKRVHKKLVNDFNGNRCTHFFGIKFKNEELLRQQNLLKEQQELAREEERLHAETHEQPLFPWGLLNLKEEE